VWVHEPTHYKIKSMNPAIIAALIGVGSTIMQQIGNKVNADKQNQYNEDMYNKYSNPVARADQLRAAGMSDAGIGQALAGFNGAGTTIQASEIGNPDITGALSGLGQLLNDSKRVENETNLKDLQLQVMNMNINEIRNNIRNNNKRLDEEIKTNQLTRNNLREDFWMKKQMNDKLLDMTDIQLRNAKMLLATQGIELLKARYSLDESKYQAHLAKFKDEWLKKVKMPYDDFFGSDNIGQVIAEALKLLAGQSLTDDDMFNEYKVDEGWPEVNVYGRDYQSE